MNPVTRLGPGGFPLAALPVITIPSSRICDFNFALAFADMSAAIASGNMNVAIETSSITVALECHSAPRVE